jgi:hypothetical protein
MFKPTSLVVAALIGGSLLSPSTLRRDPHLLRRLQHLEEWRAIADARIHALEGFGKVESRPSATMAPASTAERVLSVLVTNKRFDPSDIHGMKFEDNIWWDAEYTATGLKKTARSIKGRLKFCDLFGDTQFEIRVTIDDPIKPDEKLNVQGIGVTYNQFLPRHNWLRSTELEKMTFRFQVETVLYEDNSTERFGS